MPELAPLLTALEEAAPGEGELKSKLTTELTKGTRTGLVPAAGLFELLTVPEFPPPPAPFTGLDTLLAAPGLAPLLLVVEPAPLLTVTVTVAGFAPLLFTELGFPPLIAVREEALPCEAEG